MFYDDRIEERINSDATTIDKEVKIGERDIEVTLKVFTDGKSPFRLNVIDFFKHSTYYSVSTNGFNVPVENPERLYKLAASKFKENEEKFKNKETLLENL